MTPKQFLRKHPDAPLNENTLIDFACPKCGHRSDFHIEFKSVGRFSDMGCDEHDDMEWSDNSYCMCGNCNHVGAVEDFTIEGLDDLIAERNP